MKEYIITFILVILSLIIGFFSGRYFERKAVNKIPIIEDPPEIEYIRIQNDSILRINDSINFKVIEIEKTYEKTVDDIIRNNPDDDYDFFSTYIARYCGRYNSGTAENSESDIR